MNLDLILVLIFAGITLLALFYSFTWVYVIATLLCILSAFIYLARGGKV